MALAGLSHLSLFDLMPEKDLVIGHGNFRYKVVKNWGTLNKTKHPVTDCHEMVQDSQGRIILLTNNTKNNVIIYNKDGQLLDTWGDEYPGAHGLSLYNEGGEDFLYITDTEKHEVYKTTMDGKKVLTIPFPSDLAEYKDKDQFVPTETAIAENGNIYVADGYGAQYITVYDQKGNLINYFGGPGKEEDQFYNAHGIAIDNRGASDCLLITARQKNQLKIFDLDGTYRSTVDLPGAYICRPVVHGKNVYLATIWSGEGDAETGFISILDENNRLVSAPGGVIPTYEGDRLSHMYQTLRVFKHPHDVCVDNDENIYIPQWNAGNVYPTKLIRI